MQFKNISHLNEINTLSESERLSRQNADHQAHTKRVMLLIARRRHTHIVVVLVIIIDPSYLDDTLLDYYIKSIHLLQYPIELKQ